ncbi:MAG TPA: leucyl aminopeptidase family protein, partial [Afifellaceae bacterium]|nr:leucyl aminopeptidase family protein [Afifellaceae bacterium]
VLFGIGARKISDEPFLAGTLARRLAPGTYRLEGPAGDDRLVALGFLLGGYRFDKFKAQPAARPKLSIGKNVDRDELLREADATYLARELINRPANDLGPDEIAEAMTALAKEFGARTEIAGGQALEENFPMIFAVGKASPRRPLLVDLTWGDPSAPKVTLVGKGVVFDTGGLNIKPGGSMALMKKDMGGAANVLGLARMIMSAGLNVRLRVLVPTVENAIDGNAFRPGDILKSRKGLTVEIGNTDAEGRLILADALALADEESPSVLVSMATLTGAARVALGPELPPFYCDDDAFATSLSAAAGQQSDPVWRMPFWKPYNAMLASKVADINHISGGSFAGSVTAALFLDRFVEKADRFAHFDVFGWTPTARPASPEGGEAQGIRALFHVLEAEFG